MASGQWDQEGPICIPINCGHPGNVSNGAVQGKDFSFSKQVRFRCNQGYELVGESAVLTCEEWGDWDYEKPTCEEIQCNLPALSENTLVNTSETRFKSGSALSFSCKLGSRMQTQYNTVTCQRDGTWDMSIPSCDALHCSIPPSINNGDPLTARQEYNVGDTVRYQCDYGYDFSLEATNTKKSIDCLPTGQWETELPVCEPIECLDPPRIPRATPQGDDRTVGSKVTYTCDVGFRPQPPGRTSLECQASQEWTRKSFNCVPVRCPAPPPLLNGDLYPPAGPYPFSTKLYARCNLGYDLVPIDSVRICEADRSWSGTVPRCNPVSCGPPAPVAHGSLTLSGGDSYLDTVAVACDPGHLLIGPAVRTCQASKKWNPAESVSCAPRPCPVPPDTQFGSFSLAGSAVFGASAQYRCASGYRLEGESTLACTEDGTWSQGAPTCELILCPDLDSPNNGLVQVRSHRFLGQAAYTCAADYRMAGDSERSCQVDGTWSGQAPTCEATKCSPPDLPHGMIDYTDLSPGNNLRHTCDEGYVLRGDPIRLCQSDLTISGQPPSCDPIDCGPIDPTTHGSIISSREGTTYQAVISFTCDLGYVLSREVSRTCQSDGTWSGTSPACLPVECPVETGVLSNGVVNSTANTFGNSVSYSCLDGYRLDGLGVRTCQADGTWDQQKPVCQIVQCPELTLTNGAINTTLRSFGTEVTFSCTDPYRLDGPTTRACTASGDWSGDESQCIQVDCSPPVQITNGMFAVIDDITIKHECNDGYSLIGQATQHCELDGSWAPGPPVCQQIVCDDLHSAALPNGNIVYSSNAIGAFVNYTCNVGYALRGVSNRRCLETGNWENSQPRCEFVDCGNPPILLNGEYNGNQYSFRSVLDVTCHFGFHLAGPGSIECQEDGQWPANIPNCEKTTCPTLTFVNGGVSVTTYDVLGEAQYQCDPGFRLTGTSTRECLESGLWSGDAPVCDRIFCPRPDTLPDTTLVAGAGFNGDGTVFAFGEEVSYTCAEGFFLSGPDRRTCGSNGDWSGTDPMCNRVTCPEPLVPEHGWLNGSEVTFEALLNYGCEVGYELWGEPNPNCQANGAWSDQSQTCERISCEAPEVIENAVFQQRVVSYFWKDTGTYSCVEGYAPSGNGTIECLIDGYWSSTNFNCTIVSCPTITINDIPNSIIVPQDTRITYGGKVDVSCSVGYNLVGSSELICQSNGMWSQSLPACNIVQCPSLSPVQNGRIESLSNDYGSMATHACDTGYTLEGQDKLNCLSTGSWDAAQPVCKIVSCPNRPALISHGQEVNPKIEYVYGDSIVYRCDNGYELQGPQEIKCQASGTFEVGLPTCQRIPCPAPNDIENGNLVVQSVNDEIRNDQYNVITYTCQPGYNLLGSSQIECLLGGTWSGQSPSCSPVVCPSLSPPVDGSIVQNGVTFGESVTFTCDPGHDQVGSRTRLCQMDQTWSGEQTKCEPKVCGEPIEPFEHGIVEGDYVFKSGVTYSCLPGFALQGNSFRRCQENGTWAEGVPSCRRLSCQDPPPIENGFFSGSQFDFESEVIYSCDAGYELGGEATRTCEASLTWSGQLPTCGRISCGVPPVINNGDIRGSSYLFADRVNISCRHGYRLEGLNFRLCQANKTWSFENPHCEQVFCSNPPAYQRSSNNATVASQPFLVDTVISYQCDIGHIMDEQGMKVCEQSGTWSGSAINCYPLSCNAITSIQYGEVTGDTFTYLSVIDFTCHPGFQLFGATSVICTENGSWSSQQPSCNPIDCQPLQVANGRHKLNPTDMSRLVDDRNASAQFIYGDVLTLDCDEGYEPKGSTRVSCTIAGTWSETGARCDPVICPLPTIDNAVMPGSATLTYGDILTISCVDGFALLGASERRCRSDKNWEEPLPRCVLLACGPPIPVQNAFIEGDSFNQGESITYRCKPGFELRGNSALTCGTQNMWTGSLPVCVLLTCSALPQFPDAIVALDAGTMTFGSTATITCDMGFYNEVDPSMKCGVNGTWEHDAAFQCKPVDCGQPPSIVHGTVDVDDTTLDGTALYTCFMGYYMVSGSSMHCEEDGQWVHETPVCRAVDCSSPPTMAHAHADVSQGTEYRAVATYNCDTGYMLMNSDSNNLTCGADGLWKASVTPSCKAVDCGIPPSSPNSWFLLDNNQTNYLSYAFYQCDSGYTIRPNLNTQDSPDNSSTNVLTCSESGDWTGNAISCDPVDCGAYPVSPHMVYHSDNGTKFGASVFFSCDSGYYKTGPAFISCGPTGRWSSYTHACLPVDCGAPDSVEHGQVTFLDTTFQAEATYICDPGYELRGSNNFISRCIFSGKWSPTELPTCFPVDCSTPPGIPYGLVNFNETILNTRATYRCVDGYTFSDGSITELECKESGVWEGGAGTMDVPICTRVTCSDPAAPRNGDVTFSMVTFGSRAVYSCRPGYRLDGAAYSECSGNGAWSPDPPSCPPVECPPPPPANVNGVLTTTNFTYGSKAEYACNVGHKLASTGSNANISSISLSCNENGLWDGTAPRCEIVTCDISFTVDHGIYNFTGNSYGSQAQLECNAGYSLLGNGRIQCSESGVWLDIENSKCELIQCTNPPSIDHGLAQITSLAYDSEALYSCNPGYSLLGPNKLICRQSGWEGVAPTCELITCPTPAEIPYGKSNYSSGQQLIVEEKITYTCNPGFSLKGSASISCFPDGKWFPEVPECKPVLCPGPPTVSNSVILEDTGRRVNASVTFTCGTGYQMANNQGTVATITCGLDGGWLGQFPTCELVRCTDSPPSIPFGTFSANGDTYASQAIYTCDVGYTSAGGNDALICDGMGNWSAPPTSTGAALTLNGPRCEPISCGPPPAYPDTTANGTDFTLNQNVTYACPDGFDLLGEATSTCLFTGHWSPARFTCQVRTCSLPITPQNGSIQLSQAQAGNPPTPGDLAHVTCVENHVLVGQKSLRCMESGLWNASWPLCQQSNDICVESVGMANTQRIPAGTRPGDQVTVRCAQGYTPAGNMTSTCFQDRSWSLPAGTCERVSCGKPTPKPGSENSAMVIGWDYYYGDTVLYVCRYGHLPAHNPPVLTCSAHGLWDRQPECAAQCKQGCLNGGLCLGNNRCKCLPGWSGRRCEIANCIMPCLNGGRCVAPYKCACPHGYKGIRCEEAVCSQPCQNRGRCLMPNRCRCPIAYSGAFCETSRRFGI